MEVAVTADAHLRTREETPFRYAALEDILHQISARDITNLLIAGDLFDRDFQDYSEFEKLCETFKQIQFHIIPGNHDEAISEKSIVGENIHIYTEPFVLSISSTLFLLIPYEADAAMGEQIAHFEEELSGKDWVLVGHGDYLGSMKEVNPLEPGTYMPITRKDLERFSPQATFLGHIHKPLSVGNLHYPGSSCGLDISETGKRRFLLSDTADHSVVSQDISTQILYFDENILIVPSAEEILALNATISSIVANWSIDESDYPNMLIRIRAIGYSSDRSSVLAALEKGFRLFSFYKNEGPLIGDLLSSEDSQLNAIAGRALQLVDELDWDFDSAEPSKEQVKQAVLTTIFGVRG